MGHQRLGAVGAAGLGLADLHHVAARGGAAEVVVVGEDAVHLGTRQVQRGGDLGDERRRHEAERVLDVVEDRQQRGGAAAGNLGRNVRQVERERLRQQLALRGRRRGALRRPRRGPSGHAPQVVS